MPWCFVLGGLLDDLLVAEDSAAPETSNAATEIQAGRYCFVDRRTRQAFCEENTDRAVVMGRPVAPSTNGDISDDNPMLQSRRYVLYIFLSLFLFFFSFISGRV